MSYCVHCGVELADSEATCPLCATPVVDPHRLTTSEPTFVEELEASAGRKLNRKFLVSAIFLLLAVPFVITAAVGWIISSNFNWALYVAGAELVVWAFVCLPLLAPRVPPYILIVIDGCVVVALLALIAALSGGMRWFLIIGLPVTALMTGSICLFTLAVRRTRLSAGAKVGWAFIILAVDVMMIGVIVGLYRGTSVLPLWGWVSALPCAVLGVVLLILGHSERVSDWARRKMFL